MAITLVPVGTRAGPGTYVPVGNVGGPVAVGEYLIVQLYDAVSGRLAVQGQAFIQGPGTNFVQLGWDERSGHANLPAQEGWVDGRAMNAIASEYDSANVLVSSVGPVAYGGWDAASTSWGLITRSSSAASAEIAELLDAVRFVFPATS